ncbi:MAG: zinc ribbon domain-containing protein [Armatimonadetes bacterium]|nr:zinc ribbon domain-containing protein [Armatimonadota bacterium]
MARSLARFALASAAVAWLLWLPALSGAQERTSGPGKPVEVFADEAVAPELRRPVNLSIPRAKPVPLADAVKAISRQTQVAIRLHPSLSPDVAFSAEFVEAPLAAVLDALTRTGALKWSLNAGVVVLLPADWLQLYLGTGPPGSRRTVGACPRCGKPVLSNWSFCPLDGAPLARPRPQLPIGQRRPQ